MSESPSRLVIATRASRLALWQAGYVRDLLAAIYPRCQVDLLKLTTRGDQILDRSLSKVGGKGLFVKELETALLDGRADLAVHSLKDVPADMQQPFALPVILKRDDPRDALVSNQADALGDLPAGSVIGTSSLRREAQVRMSHPLLRVQPLRGNLDTRLGKLDKNEYAAIILAAAGLRRLGLESRIRTYLTPEQSLPAAGQGALGLEILSERSDIQAWLAPLNCPETAACCLAERMVSRLLGGSCQLPLAAFAQVSGTTLHLRALVAEPDGTQVIRSQVSGPASQAEQLGQQAAQMLLDKGAGALLARLLSPDAVV